MTLALRLFAMLSLVALAGCGANDNDPGPGGVTVGEAKALDEAAEMLEKRGRSPADENAEQAERMRQAQAQRQSAQAAGQTDTNAPQ